MGFKLTSVYQRASPLRRAATGGSQAVSAYPNFTPMILKPKTSSYNRSFLSLLSAYLYANVDDIDIERKEKDEGKRIGEKRCPPSLARIWQIATRQNFRASIFHVGRKAKNRGTRFEHFSSSRTERNRPREIRTCYVFAVASRVERNRRRFP